MLEHGGNDMVFSTPSRCQMGEMMSKKRVIKVDKSDLHKIEKYGVSTFSNIVIQLVPEKDRPCVEVHGGIIE